MRYLGALLPSLVPPVEVPRVFKSRTPPVPAPMEGVVELLEVEGVKLRCGCLY
jgi:hypothetical protein